MSYNAPQSQRCRGVGARAELHGGDPGSPHSQPELFTLFEEEPGGVWPGSVTDPVPQARFLRHVVEHRIEACPFVQILDARVPQDENQLLEAFRHLGLHIPEQVVEVPKIPHVVVVAGAGFPWCRRRNSWWKCRNSYRLPFCSSSRSLTLLEVLKIFSLDRGALQVFSQEQNSAAFSGVEHVDIPVPCGVQGLRPGQGSTASSSHSPGAADEVFTCFFRTPPFRTKVRGLVRARGRI